MSRVASRDARPRVARRAILNPTSPEFSTAGILAGQVSVISTTWQPAANDPVAFPFRLSAPAIVDQLGICHGSAAGGNFDIGVYSATWVRLVSTGSTGAVTNNVWQFVNVTDTALEALKTYYLVAARDNVTANRQRSYGVAGANLGCAFAGMQDSATDAFPLPDPLTNMAAASSAVTVAPLVAVALRAPF